MCTGQLRKNALKYVKMQLAQLIKKQWKLLEKKSIKKEKKLLKIHSTNIFDWIDNNAEPNCFKPIKDHK